MIAEHRLF